MSNEVTIWNKVMGAALSMPGVKVDRDDFLKKELKNYCSPEQLNLAISSRPINVVSKEIIDRIANACINSHTTKVTTISAVAGIPGGFAMAGTIPADMAQYYWHVFVLAQKLAYLYGFPDLRDENGNLTDTASDMLTLFVGVMMGASAANQAIKGLAKEFAKQVVKRLPQKALTKTIYYPIIKQIAKWIGVKLTKDTFAKGLGKVIPILGGLISGGLTLATFRPSAKRLQHKLQEEMFVINENYQENHNNEEQYSTYEDISNESIKKEEQITNKEMLSLMILINAAKIDHNFTEKKRSFVDNEIENSSLSEEEQLLLASSYNTEQLFQVDINLLKDDDSYSISLLKKIIYLYQLDGEISLAEKIYLKKIARELRYTPEDLKDFFNE
ncbi:hypothetical protein [uncultured Bacteroides sp.]|uniref:hypothetical protein n=1 Tax=uncultured Bacteroides sp. TaxID=162156 RepID=UPI00260BC982|nr:hypothetical protein [uncultured Bacteroides sp.]